MLKNTVFLLFVIIGTCSCASIIRTNAEIESYRKFLANSVHGKPEAPLNEKMRELQNEWERSGKFEGDIILTEEQQEALLENYKNPGSRNAVVNTAKLWPQKVLYYTVKTTNYTTAQVNAIEDALKSLADISCVKFKKANSTSKAYVVVEGKPGTCHSHVGYTGTVQYLNLAPSPLGSSCFKPATIMHEFLHALGFHHMQSTYNRDDYVKVVWEKIKAGHEHNFDKYPHEVVTNLGTAYDYGSVMHYSEYGFSIDGSKTLIPLRTTDKEIGQRVKLSKDDITKFNKLYKCPGF